MKFVFQIKFAICSFINFSAFSFEVDFCVSILSFNKKYFRRKYNLLLHIKTCIVFSTCSLHRTHKLSLYKFGYRSCIISFVSRVSVKIFTLKVLKTLSSVDVMRSVIFIYISISFVIFQFVARVSHLLMVDRYRN